MAFKTSYELHHNFAKIAEESGFVFNIHRPRVHIDWNKIRSIDFDKLIRERNFVTIEQHVNDVLECALESEFDVRILDEGVVKLFRLAQLTVEYQQFCRHHLDRSVMLLRQELIAMMQDVERSKKDLRNKDDEISKLRKKAKHNYKNPLPYGNENIATMILKTLSNNGDTLLSPYMADKIQNYNKCKYCDKVFLNQLYLKSHISRRHVNESENVVTEVDEKNEEINNYATENLKLHNEIEQLRHKLEDMEERFKKSENESRKIYKKEKATSPQNIEVSKDPDGNNHANNDNIFQTNHNKNDRFQAVDDQKLLLRKIEEWKLEEQEKYKLEMQNLKEQILSNINTIKEKDKTTETKVQLDQIKQLRNTIKEQNSEISSLKQELTKVIQTINENAKKDFEIKKKEELSHSPVLQIDVAQQYDNIFNGSRGHRMVDASTYAHLTEKTTPSSKLDIINKSHRKIHSNYDTNESHKRLEELHRKTQELLNMKSSDESSSSDSEEIDELESPKDVKSRNIVELKPSPLNVNSKFEIPNKKIQEQNVKIVANIKNKRSHLANINEGDNYDSPVKKRNKNQSKKKVKATVKRGEFVHSSPGKVVRAKMSEEVHKRLIEKGVDPLQMGVSNEIFQKQRAQLRHDEEIKKKRLPNYEKTKHSILAFLDSKAAEENTTTVPLNTSDIQEIKHSRFSSVLSNVKNKALSFIKPSEKSRTVYRKEDILKRAEIKNKTPPSSVSISPVRRASSDIVRAATNVKVQRTNETSSKKSERSRKYLNESPKKVIQVEVTNNSKEETDSDELDSIDELYYEKKTVSQTPTKSIENLINSPVKRPATVNSVYSPDRNNKTQVHIVRAQSTTDVHHSPEKTKVQRFSIVDPLEDSYDHSNVEVNNMKKILSEDNIFIQNNEKNTKGALKNAPSTSSLSKKKVIFDLDANQTKSVSASPSQSITDKSENIKNVVGSLNLEDEWDLSSIESIPMKESGDNKNPSRTTPKIAELTQRIESQLARRGDSKPPGVGSVDLLRAPTGSSNTSLGSSVLDEGDIQPANPIPMPRKINVDKDVSDLDLSEFSINDYKRGGKKAAF